MRPDGARGRRALLGVALLAALLIGALACAAGSGPGLSAWAASTADCARCHAEQAQAIRSSSSHRSSAEGCLLCHRPHAGGSEGEGQAGLQARCEDCHAAVVTQFSLPFHHPLDGLLEGGLPLRTGSACTSCHPPHGLEPSVRVHARRDAGRGGRDYLRRGACVGCHFEYAGPYQYEHEGDRNLQCLACHLPHGSPNRRLLTHAETRMLCMSCHINLDQTHIQNPGSIYRDCLRCHTEVHGSNWDSEFLR